jgi:hypothetical protein
MDYGSYRTWYAQKCTTPPSWGPLDSAVTDPGNCTDASHTNCTAVPALMAPSTASRILADAKLHKGVKKAPPKLNPIPPQARPYSRLVDATLAWLETQPGQPQQQQAKVALYLVLATPAGLPPRMLASGLEVDTSEVPTISIPYSDITSLGGHAVQLNLGSVTYRVTLDRSTKLKAASKAMAQVGQVRTHQHDPNVDGGKPRSDPKTHVVGSKKPQAATVSLISKTLVWVEVRPSTQVKVMLYRVAVTPNNKKQPVLTVNSGTEVVTTDTPTQTIPNSAVAMVGKKVCQVTLNGVTYQVVLDPGTPLGAKKAN